MFADINQDYPIDQSLEYCLEKLRRSHLALILIYSWMQQKNCMAFRLVSNLPLKIFRYTYRRIRKIILWEVIRRVEQLLRRQMRKYGYLMKNDITERT